MHHDGKKVKDDERWRTKRLLLVLDDTDGERDERVLLEMDETLDAESHIIFTSRIQCSFESHNVYKVGFLNDESAKQLFYGYAFRRDLTGSAGKFTSLADAIIKRCEGLPLALEDIGKFLGTTKDLKIWKQTIEAMDTAKDHPDLDERLWGKLRASYDGLDETLQQMFLDAATYFYYNGSLGEAKVAWRAAYNCEESIYWKKLVDLSLVYDGIDNDYIHMHEQLLSLGRKLASEPRYGRRITCTPGQTLNLLQSQKESPEQVW
jgi:hypothetical protein